MKNKKLTFWIILFLIFSSAYGFLRPSLEKKDFEREKKLLEYMLMDSQFENRTDSKSTQVTNILSQLDNKTRYHHSSNKRSSFLRSGKSYPIETIHRIQEMAEDHTITNDEIADIENELNIPEGTL